MNIGTQILKIRKEKALTQEEFGKIFHVTRQTGKPGTAESAPGKFESSICHTFLNE